MSTGRNPLDVLPSMAGDLQRVDDELVRQVTASHQFLTDIASHLITAGGKRIRPGFCIAAAATAFSVDQAASDDVIRGAASVELVHLGSLYHDDVMDGAESRHHVPSVNEIWGNHKAILAGDFLLARASEIGAALGVEVAGLLGATISSLVEGQTLELQHQFNRERTEVDYWASIDGKTAALLATSCRIGGIVAQLERSHIDAVTDFGRAYGTAFQIVDDVLDLVSTDADMGKPTGHDMAEGVYTLPVITALGTSVADQLGGLLTDAMTPDDCTKAADLVRQAGGIQVAIDQARAHTGKAIAALDSLPASPGVTGLRAAADHLVNSVEAAAQR